MLAIRGMVSLRAATANNMAHPHIRKMQALTPGKTVLRDRNIAELSRCQVAADLRRCGHPLWLSTYFLRGVFIIGGALATASALASEKTAIAVSVHGVNYSNQAFSFSLVDPETAVPLGAGELVERFSAGGTVCCYNLPLQWRPGTKVRIDAHHWLKKEASGKLPEIVESHVFEVPSYADGHPGNLWVLRREDGSYAAVSTQYRPDHEKWPDIVKGWPVPSKEYRREHIDLEISLARSDLRMSERTSQRIRADPTAYARKMWDFWKSSKSRDIAKFSGPDDPSLHSALKEEVDEEVNFDRTKLQTLEGMQ